MRLKYIFLLCMIMASLLLVECKTQSKVEKATLGDLGALAQLKQKLQQEEQQGNEPKEAKE